MSNSIDLGEFVCGEIPVPIVYQFLDSDNTAINITGYTAKFVYRERFGSATTVDATLSDAVNGKVSYAWDGSEFTSPGSYEAEFWVGNASQRYASWLITWVARLPVAGINGTPNI